MSKSPTPPFIPPLPPSPHGSSEPAPKRPSVNITTTPNLNQSLSIERGNTPYPDSPYPNHSPIIAELSPLETPYLRPLPLSPHSSPGLAPVHPPVTPTTTQNSDHSVPIEGGNTSYPASTHPNDSPIIPQLPIGTPYIPPLSLPISPDSSPGLSPVHPSVIPTTTPNLDQSVSIQGGNTPYPASTQPNHSPIIPQLPIGTPYIPPLPSTDSSPELAPKQNITTAPNWNQSVSVEEGNTTPYLDSAYPNGSPFISPVATPGVIPEPPPLPPQIQPESNRHGLLGEDFTGYPRFPAAPQHQPPMSAFSNTGSHSSSPHYRHSVPSGYQSFDTPWVSNTAQLPPSPWSAPQWPGLQPPSTPWPPPQQLPPRGFSPAFSGYGPPHVTNGQDYPGLPGVAAGYQRFYGSPYSSPWIAQPSQFDQLPHTSKLPDRMDPFVEGKGYGAVLDPFLIKVLKVNVRLNPLITPLLEAGYDRVHLIWNMLFPTSMVQRSSDPSHISWSEGRDAPATFPRISSLSIVSDTIPWVLNVEAKDNGIGVTCGEVIDSIGYELGKFSYKRDYKRLTPSLRSEVGEAYYRNRSPEFGVPGGQLGQGMKRLDFLCQDTMFAGIEIDDLVVKRVCGDVLPCVFVLKCSKAPTVKQEAGDRRSKLKTYKTASSRLRSRAKSQLNKLWYIFRVLPRQAP